MLDGLSALAKLVQRQTHIPQHNAFASAVANLANDEQCLFKELEGAARLAEVRRKQYLGRPARCLRLEGHSHENEQCVVKELNGTPGRT